MPFKFSYTDIYTSGTVHTVAMTSTRGTFKPHLSLNLNRQGQTVRNVMRYESFSYSPKSWNAMFEDQHPGRWRAHLSVQPLWGRVSADGHESPCKAMREISNTRVRLVLPQYQRKLT